MNATDPKYITAIASKIVQNVTDGDDQPEDIGTVYGILCSFARDILNDVQGETLDAIGRPREEAPNALRHLSQRFYSMGKELIENSHRGCGGC